MLRVIPTWGATVPSNFEGSSACTEYAEVWCASVPHFGDQKMIIFLDILEKHLPATLSSERKPDRNPVPIVTV